MKSFEVQPADGALTGAATVSGDKSISHRAIILGGLCDGESEVRGLSEGEDNLSTRRALEQLGVGVERRGDLVVVTGHGLRGLSRPSEPIDCGNAGTGMRLLCGLAAGQPFDVELTGDESLTRRPMKRVAAPLGLMGARVEGRSESGNIYPPLRVSGSALHGIDYPSPVASAQVKSAILLAGLYAKGTTTVREPGSSRDHTERMFEFMGISLGRPEKHVVVLDPAKVPDRLEPRTILVPADPSSAAFLVAAALVCDVERLAVPGVCINPTRTGFLDVLSNMNARIEREAMNGSGVEPVADLVLSRGAGDELVATRVAGDVTVRAIDEIPILAVVAAFAEGETVFSDAAELRVKESDRIATTCAMLRAFGVEVEERDDGFSVLGKSGRSLRAARVDAAGDHRIAMAAAVAALRADGPTRIDDVENVATSFPGFDQTLCRLGAAIRVIE